MKRIDRQDHDTLYTYFVPGYSTGTSNTNVNCYRIASSVNCSGSTTSAGRILKPWSTTFKRSADYRAWTRGSNCVTAIHTRLNNTPPLSTGQKPRRGAFTGETGRSGSVRPRPLYTEA